jgi:hypothetical protein
VDIVNLPTSNPGNYYSTYSAIWILPFSDRNIYMNQLDPFYFWSGKNPCDALFNAILPSHPSILFAETQQVGSNSVPLQMQMALTDCHAMFQYSGIAP